MSSYLLHNAIEIWPFGGNGVQNYAYFFCYIKVSSSCSKLTAKVTRAFLLGSDRR